MEERERLETFCNVVLYRTTLRMSWIDVEVPVRIKEGMLLVGRRNEWIGHVTRRG